MLKKSGLVGDAPVAETGRCDGGAETSQLTSQRLGLNRTAEDLDDLIAQATRKRWSPAVLLEPIVAAGNAAALNGCLTRARLGRFNGSFAGGGEIERIVI